METSVLTYLMIVDDQSSPFCLDNIATRAYSSSRRNHRTKVNKAKKDYDFNLLHAGWLARI